ncbi:MAG: hypothetical protein IJT35_07020, partial [Paludibacteraceae bacterium]|nr:hypothetical protein [Paludibacteraceae bacterium]
MLANSGYTQLINNGTTNSITIGTSATYYNVNVVSNNNSYGTVTSTYKSGYIYANNRSQEYKKNSVYTISATPRSGYRFVSWSDGGAQTHDITITGNQTYTATFESLAGQQYTVTTAVNNNSLGSVTPIGYQYENTNWDVAVTINDPANYYLSDWLRDGVSMGVRTNPLPVTVTKAETYTAVITAKEWTLTVNSDNTSLGTVSGGKKCYDGETTTITATPANSFSSFVKWQKNGVDYAGGASINVTVNANDTYTAFFSGRNIIEVDIPNATYVDRNATYSLRGNSNGTSSESSGYYVDVQFNASTDALYSVDGIKHNGSNMSFTTKTIEGLEQPCGNRVITHLACYNATGDVYMFNIHWRFPWSGDTNDIFDGGTINTNMEVSYNSTYNAIEVYGYRQTEEWNGQYTYRMVDFLFVTGQRCSDEIKLPVGTYDINCTGEPGTVMSWQSGMGSDFSLCWSQNQGVDLGNKLLDHGTITVSKSGTTYTLVLNAYNSYDRALTATVSFNESIISGTIPNYTLNVTTDGHGTAKVYRYDCSGNENLVSNSGSYKQGSYFKLEATPASGYAFDYWTIDGVDEHFTNNPEILDGLYDNAIVTAHFKTAVMHTVTISTPTNGTITVMDGETTINNGDQVEEGTVLTVTATPATGYHFDSWANNGAASVTVNSDVTIGATFAPNTYNVSFAAGSGSGTMTDQVFTYGVAQNIKANTFTAPTATATYNYNGATGGN